MEETNNRKEVTIVPPEGYEIDKENSTLGHIVFKKIETKPYRWRDDDEAKMNGYYIEEYTSEVKPVHGATNYICNYNIFATEKQAYSALAMARISQIMENDKRFGGAVTDEEWKVNNGNMKYAISRFGDDILIDSYCHKYHFLSFYTYQQANLFLQENEDLVKDYLMIE